MCPTAREAIIQHTMFGFGVAETSSTSYLLCSYESSRIAALHAATTQLSIIRSLVRRGCLFVVDSMQFYTKEIEGKNNRIGHKWKTYSSGNSRRALLSIDTARFEEKRN